MIKVLDHGYVRFIEDWGYGLAEVQEAGIIEAARQSTQGSFRGWEQDERLLRFLFLNNPKHATPFEFAGMTIEVQAPILVFREWHRHRTQSYNEMSARYSPVPDVHYMPTVDRCMMGKGDKNKQAQAMAGSVELTADAAMKWLKSLEGLYVSSQAIYRLGLDIGVPKEVARCAMVVSRYSRMRATANLRNWLAFATLRMHPDAQWEIRQFANVVGDIIGQRFPKTWALFNEERGGFAPQQQSPGGKV